MPPKRSNRSNRPSAEEIERNQTLIRTNREQHAAQLVREREANEQALKERSMRDTRRAYDTKALQRFIPSAEELNTFVKNTASTPEQRQVVSEILKLFVSDTFESEYSNKMRIIRMQGIMVIFYRKDRTAPWQLYMIDRKRIPSSTSDLRIAVNLICVGIIRVARNLSNTLVPKHAFFKEKEGQNFDCYAWIPDAMYRFSFHDIAPLTVHSVAPYKSNSRNFLPKSVCFPHKDGLLPPSAILPFDRTIQNQKTQATQATQAAQAAQATQATQAAQGEKTAQGEQATQAAQGEQAVPKERVLAVIYVTSSTQYYMVQNSYSRLSSAARDLSSITQIRVILYDMDTCEYKLESFIVELPSKIGTTTSCGDATYDNFFEHDGEIFCIQTVAPQHGSLNYRFSVIKLENVVNVPIPITLDYGNMFNQSGVISRNSKDQIIAQKKTIAKGIIVHAPDQTVEIKGICKGVGNRLIAVIRGYVFDRISGNLPYSFLMDFDMDEYQKVWSNASSAAKQPVKLLTISARKFITPYCGNPKYVQIPGQIQLYPAIFGSGRYAQLLIYTFDGTYPAYSIIPRTSENPVFPCLDITNMDKVTSTYVATNIVTRIMSNPNDKGYKPQANKLFPHFFDFAITPVTKLHICHAVGRKFNTRALLPKQCIDICKQAFSNDDNIVSDPFIKNVCSDLRFLVTNDPDRKAAFMVHVREYEERFNDKEMEEASSSLIVMSASSTTRKRTEPEPSSSAQSPATLAKNAAAMAIMNAAFYSSTVTNITTATTAQNKKQKQIDPKVKTIIEQVKDPTQRNALKAAFIAAMNVLGKHDRDDERNDENNDEQKGKKACPEKKD